MDNFYYVDESDNYHAPSAIRGLRATSALASPLLNPTHVVYESVAQHKFSRLAMASYYFKKQSKVRSLLSKMDELSHFQMDDALSTVENSVFHDAVNGETVIAFRGTSSLKDVGTDIHILLSVEQQSKRFKEAEELTETVMRKCGNNVKTTGHSLGGGLSQHVGNKYELENHNFNGAESLRRATKKSNAMTFNYRTHGDAVSVGNEVGKTKTIRVSTKIGNEGNIISQHRLDNFFDDNADMVTEQLDGVEDGVEMLQVEKSAIISSGQIFLGEAIGAGLAIYDTVRAVRNKSDVADTIGQVADDLAPVPTQPLYATDYGRNESMEHTGLRQLVYDTAHALRHGDGAFATRAANDIAPNPFLEQSSHTTAFEHMVSATQKHEYTTVDENTLERDGKKYVSMN